MKYRNYAFSYVVAIGMVILVLFSFAKKMDLFSKPLENSEVESLESFFESSVVSEEAEDFFVDMTATNHLLPTYTRTDGSVLTGYGVRYTVHSVEVTKQLPGELNQPSYVNNSIWMDSDGTIVSNHSYVIVELTMENMDFFQSQLEYTGVYLFVSNGVSMSVDDPNVQPKAISFSKDAPVHGQYADLTKEFKVGQSIRYKVAFIQKDADLRSMKNMIFIPNAYNNVEPRMEDENTGDIKWNSSVKAILLDEFVADMDISSPDYIPPEPQKPTEYVEDGVIQWAFRQEKIGEIIVSKKISDLIVCPHFVQDETLYSDGYAAEGYSFVSVWVEEENIVPDDPNIHMQSVDYHIGWNWLYLYSGDTQLDKVPVYGVLFSDECRISDGWFGYLEKRGDTAQYMLAFIVPDEILENTTDVFLLFTRVSQTSLPMIYDAVERQLVWDTNNGRFALISLPD